MKEILRDTVKNYIKICYPELLNMKDQIKKNKMENKIYLHVEEVFNSFLIQKISQSNIIFKD